MWGFAKIETLSHHVKSEFASQNHPSYFSFSKLCLSIDHRVYFLSHGFQWLLLDLLKFKIPVIHTMHNGQVLKHPLELTSPGVCLSFLIVFNTLLFASILLHFLFLSFLSISLFFSLYPLSIAFFPFFFVAHLIYYYFISPFRWTLNPTKCQCQYLNKIRLHWKNIFCVNHTFQSFENKITLKPFKPTFVTMAICIFQIYISLSNLALPSIINFIGAQSLNDWYNLYQTPRSLFFCLFFFLIKSLVGKRMDLSLMNPFHLFIWCTFWLHSMRQFCKYLFVQLISFICSGTI